MALAVKLGKRFVSYISSCSYFSLHPFAYNRNFAKTTELCRIYNLRIMSSSILTEPVSLPAQPSIDSSTLKTDDSTVKPTETELSAVKSELIPDRLRIKRRKTVLMLSYCGKDYYGMQRNPDTKTIEDDLFKAMLRCNYIDEEVMKRPAICFFQRAARTDKHVSAARQIISLKMPDDTDIAKINEHLPPAIRVMGLKRVTKNFDSKGNCDARTYMYMSPTFAFAPYDAIVSEKYRMPPDVLEQLREILKKYIGPKNFHNFTSRKKFSDPSAIRFIKTFTCSEPFEKDGMEYVILEVKGQSFMLHQIRKMIGLVMAMMRGFASDETLTKTFGKDRIDIPRAPGVGLMLGHVHYERYDKRYGTDGMHETLTWESVEDKVKKFCDEQIFPVITKAEKEDKSMLEWMATLPYHTYDVREHGAVPKMTAIGNAWIQVEKNAANILKRDLEGGKESDSDDDEGTNETNAKKIKVEKSEPIMEADSIGTKIPSTTS